MKKIIPITAIIIGIVNILVGYIYLAPPGKFLKKLFGSEKWLDYPFIYFFLTLSIFSLILGIWSLKLKLGRTSAIFGIILSILALLLWLFIWLWVVGWSIA